MKLLRKWMSVSVCAALGTAAMYHVTRWVMSCVLSRHHWASLLGFQEFDWVSPAAARDYLLLGFIMGVGLTLGAAGGVLAGQRLDRHLSPTDGRSANRQTA